MTEWAARRLPWSAEMVGRRGAPPRSTQNLSKWRAKVSALRSVNVPEALSHPSPAPPGSLYPTLLRATSHYQLTKQRGIEWLTLEAL